MKSPFCPLVYAQPDTSNDDGENKSCEKGGEGCGGESTPRNLYLQELNTTPLPTGQPDDKELDFKQQVRRWIVIIRYNFRRIKNTGLRFYKLDPKKDSIDTSS